jgi:hypothetical protein
MLADAPLAADDRHAGPAVGDQPMNAVNEPTATSDPLIDEVRAIRKAISDRFGNDVRRLGEHLRKLEQSHPGPLVRLERSADDEVGSDETPVRAGME